MKKGISFAALALVLSAGSALAADLPSRKAQPAYVPPPAPPLWTGFYVGLNAGGTWSASDNTSVATAPFGADAVSLTTAALGTTALGTNSGGFIGGGQVGYNYQFNPNIVVGLEADIQGIAGTNGTQSFANAAGGTFGTVAVFPYTTVAGGSVTKSLDYLGTVRGRVGYLVTPTILVYGTGGLAYGGTNFGATAFGLTTIGTATGVASSSVSSSDTRVGWTAGGGLEWMFMPNWSAKVEYLYYDLGSVALSAPVTSTAGGTTGLFGVNSASTRFDGHIVRAGLNYHFNWGSPLPVMAKY